MNLSTATPSEIDQAIADLEATIWQQRHIVLRATENMHRAAGDRKRPYGRAMTWKMSDDEARQALLDNLADTGEHFLTFGGRDKAAAILPAIEAATAEIDRLDGEVQQLEAIFRARGGWSRFHQLRSTSGARIHSSRWCQGLHRSELGDLGWHPELSGKSEEQAVAELGPVMCSKCFPSAPVEWRRDPADLTASPDACPGAGKAPVEGSIERRKNYTGVSYWGACTRCGDGKLRKLTQANKIPKHDKK